jgi:hypothetical protein
MKMYQFVSIFGTIEKFVRIEVPLDLILEMLSLDVDVVSTLNVHFKYLNLIHRVTLSSRTDAITVLLLTPSIGDEIE